MAPTKSDDDTNGSAFTKPLRGLTRVVSDGFYGATYIPEQSGQSTRGSDQTLAEHMNPF
jgi:hypothetical protein